VAGGLAMILALQILVLFIGAGGSVLTAFTLPESRAKWAVVSTFGTAGVVGLVLTVLTYEQLTFADVGVWGWSYLQSIWIYLTALIQRRWLQVLVALAIGIAIGTVVPLAYDKLKIRKWYSSHDIFQLADTKLMEGAVSTEEEIHQLSLRIMDLQEQRANYRVPFGSAPVASESEGMAALTAAVREAHAQSSALLEQRERARQRALGDIIEKLKSGKLIARGYISPAGANSKQIEIPAGHWKLVRFNGDYTEAANNNVRYVGLEIARSRRWF
jgi:hypothetical protein